MVLPSFDSSSSPSATSSRNARYASSGDGAGDARQQIDVDRLADHRRGFEHARDAVGASASTFSIRIDAAPPGMRSALDAVHVRDPAVRPASAGSRAR